MAVINFPDSPSDGDTQTVGGITYTYSSSKGYWTAASSGGGGGGGASVTTGDSPPASPSQGDLWFDSSVAKTYVYYNDGSSSQWVQLNPSGGSDGTDGTDGADATGDGESPIIYTEPPTSHILNMDGTTSTIQMQAVDPEGTAITYGIAYANSTNARPAQLSADTTINQTTGTYTFTPSTTESDTGTFKARLSASDGIQTSTRFVNIDLSFGLTDVYGFRFVQTSTAYIFTRFWAVILGENGSIHNETNFGTEASWSPAGDSGGDVDQTVSSLTSHYGKYFVDEASATFGQTLTTGLKTAHMFNSTSNSTHDLKWTTARTIKGILISGDDTNGNDYWSGGYVQAYVGGTTSSHLVSTQYTFVNNTVSAPAVSKYYSFI